MFFHCFAMACASAGFACLKLQFKFALLIHKQKGGRQRSSDVSDKLLSNHACNCITLKLQWRRVTRTFVFIWIPLYLNSLLRLLFEYLYTFNLNIFTWFLLERLHIVFIQIPSYEFYSDTRGSHLNAPLMPADPITKRTKQTTGKQVINQGVATRNWPNEFLSGGGFIPKLLLTIRGLPCNKMQV